MKNKRDKEGTVIISCPWNMGLVIPSVILVGSVGIYFLLREFNFLKINFGWNEYFIGIITIIVLYSILILGCRNKIIINRTELILINTILGIKIYTFSINKINIRIGFPSIEKEEDHLVYISHESDDYDASYESDWIEFRHRKKIIYTIGDVKTVVKIMEVLKNGI